MGRRFKTPKEPKGPKYSAAPEVEELARSLIEDHHSHLVEARIKYLFRNGKWAKKGRSVLGQAKLASEDTRFIGQYEFVIIVNLVAWNNASAATREALIDHELYHCGCEVDRAGNKRWNIVDHDVTEFIAVVRRHGLWEDDLQRLMKAAQEGPFVEGVHNEIPLSFDVDQEPGHPPAA